MIKVTKQGEEPREVHFVDLSAWVEEGWVVGVETPELIASQQEDLDKPGTESIHDKTQRIKVLPFEEIEALAKTYGVEKAPEQTWRDLAPSIATAEYAAEHCKSSPSAKTTKSAKTQKAKL